MRIALTGGMGCGKSTAGKLFEQRGFVRIDSDALVHQLLAEDARTIADVEAAFGAGVLQSDGGVDRTALGKIVFDDAARLATLESILHPRVREAWKAQSKAAEKALVEIPLLFEKNLQNRFDFAVCVTCHPLTQSERLKARGMDPAQAKARISRQMPLSRKVELADFALLNDGSHAFLDRQVGRLVAHLETLC